MTKLLLPLEGMSRNMRNETIIRGVHCAKCGAEKDRRPNGRLQCPPCEAERARLWYARNTERALARQRAYPAWRVSNPEQYRAAWLAHKEANAARLAAYKAEYNRTHREEARAYRQANAERIAAWRLANPDVGRKNANTRRARKLQAVCEHGETCVTVELLKSLRVSLCTYCDKPATEADHFMPLKRGGLHCRENLVPACRACNGSKHARDPYAWLAERGMEA